MHPSPGAGPVGMTGSARVEMMTRSDSGMSASRVATSSCADAPLSRWKSSRIRTAASSESRASSRRGRTWSATSIPGAARSRSTSSPTAAPARRRAAMIPLISRTVSLSLFEIVNQAIRRLPRLAHVLSSVDLPKPVGAEMRVTGREHAASSRSNSWGRQKCSARGCGGRNFVAGNELPGPSRVDGRGEAVHEGACVLGRGRRRGSFNQARVERISYALCGSPNCVPRRLVAGEETG